MKKFLSALLLAILVQTSFACTANFTASVSGNMAMFSNTSTGPGGPASVYATYHWNYGDGNTANGWPPAHTYASPGTYTVCLVAQWIDSLNSSVVICADTICQSVTAGAPLNQIQGYLVLDSGCSFPNPNYTVWLITYDATNTWLEAIDSVTFTASATNQYTFLNEPAGTYRVKAMVNNAPTSINPIPTYSNSSLYWNTADSFVYSGLLTSASHNVIFQCGSTPMSGPGFISGNVTTGANKGTKTTNGTANIEMLITAAGYKSYVRTDANGDFTFPALNYGTYTVTPEVIGYHSTPWVITLSATTPNVSDANFHIATNPHSAAPVTTGINNIAKANNIAIFPNPTTGLVNITSTETATAIVSDLVGHKVMETAVKAGNSQLNISNLKPGVYFINIKGEGVNYGNKIVLQH